MRFATFAVALAAPFLVSAAPTKHKRASPNDITVLKFAEVLEQLETEFYKQALNKFVAKDFVDAGIAVPEVAMQNFQAILDHETAHTQFLDAALLAVGAKPVEGCTFNFDSVLTDVKTMASVARVVEAVGVGAYLGGAALVDDKSVLIAAGSILTIEARHQSFLNVINGANSIPQAFDIALTPPQVLALAGGFVQGCDLSTPENLGIKPNDPITMTNNGTVTPGTLLTFDSPAIPKAEGKEISCQMLTGGNTTALSFPLDQCIVPTGINGPVAVFLTTNPQPLAADVVVQSADGILAGPTIAFIDSQPDALGALVRQGSGPVQISDEITPDQANADLSQASGSVTTETSAAATATDATDIPTDTAATESSSEALDPEFSAPASDPAATPAQANSAPTSAPAPAVDVIGVWSAPV